VANAVQQVKCVSLVKYVPVLKVSNAAMFAVHQVNHEIMVHARHAQQERL
jgi:hypothetical protein